jgi:hypothetical protein
VLAPLGAAGGFDWLDWLDVLVCPGWTFLGGSGIAAVVDVLPAPAAPCARVVVAAANASIAISAAAQTAHRIDTGVLIVATVLQKFRAENVAGSVPVLPRQWNHFFFESSP